MRRIIITLVVMSLAIIGLAQAQETAPATPSPPAATHTQSECTGFIAEQAIPQDLYVVGGGDDDFHSVARQFVQGESVFVSPPEGGNLAVGAEYRVVRRADELFLTMRYGDERSALRKVGQPYEDVGLVRVTHVNPEGIVAKVTLSCGPIMPGDTLIPFEARAIPTYALTTPLDHFAPLNNNKIHGRITATENNFGFIGAPTVVYLNLGQKDRTQPGQRFRIYKPPSSHKTGFLASERTPPEVIGEAVVLTVQGKSCTAMVVASYREISSGDYVELE